MAHAGRPLFYSSVFLATFAGFRADGAPGERTVPSLVGLSAADAKRVAADTGIELGFEVGRAAVTTDEAFTVYEQEPKAGSKLGAGEKLRVTVFGKSAQGEARRTEPAPARAAPADPSERPAGTPATVPSSGRVMPDLVGLTAADARGVLVALGVTASFQVGPAAAKSREAFRVMAQSPAAGAPLAGQSSATLTLRGPAARTDDGADFERELSAVGVPSDARGGSETVDAATGRLVIRATDLVLAAGAATIAVERHLLPEARRPGLLGRRWRLNWEKSIQRADNLVVLEDGGVLTLFERDPVAGVWKSAGGAVLVLSDGKGEVEWGDGTRYVFDGKGRLVEQIEPNGTAFRLGYNEKGRLALVEGPFKTWLRFLVTGDGRLARVEASSSATARYAHGSVPNWNHPDFLTYRYEYDARGLVTHIDDPQVGALELRYDDLGRVTRRGWRDRGNELYQYDDAAGVRKLIDRWGRVTITETKQVGQQRWITTVDPLGRREVLVQDPAGRIVETTNAYGQTTRHVHDARGRVIQTTDDGGTTRLEYLAATRLPTAITEPSGVVTTFQYDARRNLVAVRVGNRLLRARTYDARGLLLSTREGDAAPTKFEYDEQGRRIATESAAVGRTEFAYDRRGNLVKSVDALGHVSTWVYDEFDRLVSATDGAGAATRFEYGPRGELSRLVGPDGGVQTFTYRRDGQVAARQGPGDRSDRFTYDPRGRLVRRESSQGDWETFEFDVHGRRTARRSSSGAAWEYVFDRFGRLVEERGPLGHAKKLAYDPRGFVASVTDGLGRTTRFEHDAHGQVTSITDPAGRRQQCVYDGEGRLLEATDPLGRKARVQYDELGALLAVEQDSRNLVKMEGDGVSLTVERPGKETIAYRRDAGGRPTAQAFANGESFQFTYDALGRITTATDALDHAWSAKYSPVGELVELRSPAGAAFAYAYERGKVATITDPLGHGRSCEYDDQGRRLRSLDPLGRAVEYEYGADGAVVAIQAADGSRTRFDHDLLGRVARITRDDEPPLVYTRDAVGNVIEMREGDYRATYRFDDVDRVIEAAFEPAGRTIRYRYDDADRRIRVEIVGIGAWNYAYDALDRVTQITDESGARVALGYDEANQITRVTLPNGLRIDRRFDPRGRLLELTVKDKNDTIVLSRRYEHDKAGNLARQSGGAQGAIDYAYDTEGRLVAAAAGKVSTKFEYDAVGNRLFPEGAEYDAGDQLVKLGKEVFTYSPRGELIARQAGRDKTEYRFNGAGRLAQVLKNGKVIAEYRYDPEGRRIWKKVGDKTTHYVYDGGRLLLEVAAGKPRAWPPGPVLEVGAAAGDERLFPITDLVGSVIAVADASGALGAVRDYEPFGAASVAEKDKGAASPIPFGFGGGQYDPETGLVYFRLRYYDPSLGRFLSPDPAPGQLTNPPSLHPYQYAYNNPLRYIDPTGATAAEIADGIADAAGSAGASVGYGVGYGVGYLASSPVRAWNWATGNSEGNARLDRGLDSFSRNVTGVAADTVAASAASLVADPLRFGSGLGTASVDVQQGHYGMATLNTLGDVGRAVSIGGAVSNVYRPAVNLLNGTPGSAPKLYSAQNNVNEILAGKRIWGQTEGSVYAGTNPRTDGLAGYLANTREPRPGDVAFVFEGQAASLFKPHEVTGPFGLIKRLGGQNKAGFGDIAIKEFTRGPNGEVIITQAELLAGQHAGPKLWGIFTQGQRLAGRRAFDATATAVLGVAAGDEIAKGLDKTFGKRGRDAGSRDPVDTLTNALAGTDDGKKPVIPNKPKPGDLAKADGKKPPDKDDDPLAGMDDPLDGIDISDLEPDDPLAGLDDPFDSTDISQLGDDDGLDDVTKNRASDLAQQADIDANAGNRAADLDQQLTQADWERERARARDGQEDFVNGGQGSDDSGGNWIDEIVPILDAIGSALEGGSGGGEGHHHPH